VDHADHAVYVANGESDTVSVIDEATGKVTRTIPVGAGADAVAVDHAAHTVYAASQFSHTVSVIDEATGKVTHTIPVGGADSELFDLAVDPAARIAYVTDYDTGTVWVVCLTTNTVIARVHAASALSVAVDSARHTAYVTGYLTGIVSVIQPCRPQ
jgi:YVTN family beta-propeller protein